MAIEFVCPACQGILSVADDAVGRVVRCGSCLTTLRVPAPSAESSPPPEAPPPTRRVVPVEGPRSSADRDEHGEPRSPRRSSRKKRTGRSPLFWLFVIVCGLGFLTCLSCGGLTLVLATPRWFKHEPADGGYKVDLPAPINPDVADQAKLKLKADQSVEGTMLVGRLELYLVWYSDLDRKGQRINDDVLLKAAIDSLKNEASGTIVRQAPKKVNGHVASEVVITQNDGETYHCLVVVTERRIYVAAVGGPFVKPDGNKRIRQFLDSFEIVKGGNPFRGKPAPNKDDQ